MKQQPLRSGVIKSKGAGMRAMRFLAVFLCALLSAGLFAGCGSGGEEEASTLTVHSVTEDTISGTVMIGVSSDVPDVTPLLDGLPENYTTESYDSEKALLEALGEGRVQMAVLTPGGAATQYKSDPSFKLVSPVFLGGYRFVGHEGILTISDPYRPSPGGAAPDTAQSSGEGTAGDGGDGTEGDGGDGSMEDGSAEAVQTQPAAPAEVTYPYDPVEAGDISPDNILPSQLRNGRVNVWHDTETLIDLAKALGRMDGMTSNPTVIRRYEEETPSDYLTEYNHFALTNVCTPYGGQAAFTDLTVLLDVDAYWEAMTGEPLPSAILVVSNALLEQAEGEGIDAAAVLNRDLEAAMAAYGVPEGGAGRIAFYGTSNRGDSIVRTYYNQVYGILNYGSYIPDDAFYMK